MRRRMVDFGVLRVRMTGHGYLLIIFFKNKSVKFAKLDSKPMIFAGSKFSKQE
jgi:hypothetical protein